MMGKISKIIMAAVVCGLVLVPCMGTFAATNAEGTVTYDGEELVTEYSEEEMRQAFGSMVPGDEITYKINLVNASGTGTDWYMLNQVKSSFEDAGRASNGAYTYEIAYTDPEGKEEILFTNNTVGGDKGENGEPEGLHGATESMDKMFHLARLEDSEKASLRITVGLDGESQPNSYMDQAADLTVKFAVEKDEEQATTKQQPATTKQQPTAAKRGSNAKTGDESSAAAYIIIAAAAVVAIAVLLVVNRRRREAGK